MKLTPPVVRGDGAPVRFSDADREARRQVDIWNRLLRWIRRWIAANVVEVPKRDRGTVRILYDGCGFPWIPEHFVPIQIIRPLRRCHELFLRFVRVQGAPNLRESSFSCGVAVAKNVSRTPWTSGLNPSYAVSFRIVEPFSATPYDMP